MTTFDLERVRAETPGCLTCVHFNNAGASLMPDVVLRTVVEHLELEAAHGGYEAAERVAERLAAVYVSLARLIGAAPTEIAFTENATRAFDMAFYALPLGRGDRILIGESEYVSHELAYRRAARDGIVLEVVPEDESGRLSLPDLERMLDERVRLVSVGHVATNSGIVQPVAEIGAILRDSPILFLVDACQSVGQLPIDVREVGCDILAATGRKYLRGPRGTGFLYVSQRLLERLDPPFPDVRGTSIGTVGELVYVDDGRRFETWEYDHAAKLGLGAAVDYALGLGLDAIAAEVCARATSLRSKLQERDHVDLFEAVAEPSGLTTFAVRGVDARAVERALRARDINISVSKLTDTPSRTAPRGHREWIRASAHYFNSEEEIETLVSALDELRPCRS